MGHHRHLTLEEREMVLKFQTLGYSITAIAKELRRNKSTISRELNRNSTAAGYVPVQAEQMYHKRRRECHLHKLLEDPVLYAYVKDRFLNHQWSPEEIQGRLLLEKSGHSISCCTIYRAVYAGMFNDIPEEYILEKFDELNKRPRKCLGYRTPYEIYYSTSLRLT